MRMSLVCKQQPAEVMFPGPANMVLTYQWRWLQLRGSAKLATEEAFPVPIFLDESQAHIAPYQVVALTAPTACCPLPWVLTTWGEGDQAWAGDLPHLSRLCTLAAVWVKDMLCTNT